MRIGLWAALLAVVFGGVFTVRMERSRQVALRLVDVAVRQPSNLGYSAVAVTKIPRNGEIKEVKLQIAQWPASKADGSDGRLRVSGTLPDGKKIDYNNAARPRGIIPGGRGADRERLLRKNYVPVYAGVADIAGREADVLILRSRIPNRPELTVWIDRQTHLALGWRKISAKQTLIAETRIVDLRPGAPANSPPPISPKKKKRFPLTLQQVEKIVEFTPKQPRTIPDGFQLVGYGIHDCPCACGMQSAALRYSDGVGSFTVFETSDPKHKCHAAGLTELFGKNCTSGSLDGDTVAGVQRGDMCVAVVGDLTDRDAQIVALTVPVIRRSASAKN